MPCSSGVRNVLIEGSDSYTFVAIAFPFRAPTDAGQAADLGALCRLPVLPIQASSDL